MNRFFVCWYDSTTGEHGIEAGENGYAWDEIDEVCSHFRAEDNGLDYYVGDVTSNPVLPTWEEHKEAAELWTDQEPCASHIREAKLMAFIRRIKYVPFVAAKE